MADLTTVTLLLGRLSRLNEAAVTDVCATHGTTPAEVRVMALLMHRPERSASPSDIAAFVVQTSGGLTATLRRLEADGYVERRNDPADGRGRLVQLTDPGAEFHERVIDAVTRRVSRAFLDLDLDLADQVIRDLVDGFEQAEGSASSSGFVAGITVSSHRSPATR
ncbi:MAG: MarR family transcriptional regulator [Acidimicrobiales bacterium]